MIIETINTKKGSPPGGHYSQGKTFGNLLFTAGQVPVDPITSEIRNSSIEEETRQTILFGVWTLFTALPELLSAEVL